MVGHQRTRLTAAQADIVKLRAKNPELFSRKPPYSYELTNPTDITAAILAGKFVQLRARKKFPRIVFEIVLSKLITPEEIEARHAGRAHGRPKDPFPSAETARLRSHAHVTVPIQAGDITRSVAFVARRNGPRDSPVLHLAISMGLNELAVVGQNPLNIGYKYRRHRRRGAVSPEGASPIQTPILRWLGRDDGASHGKCTG